jgi:hypothetical protein
VTDARALADGEPVREPDHRAAANGVGHAPARR